MKYVKGDKPSSIFKVDNSAIKQGVCEVNKLVEGLITGRQLPRTLMGIIVACLGWIWLMDIYRSI